MARTIESRLIPEDGVNIYSYHPGFDAEACPARRTINAATGMTQNGFGCYHTGGHCLPNTKKECFKPVEESNGLKYPVMVRLPDGSLVPDPRFNGETYEC